jgi:hypothetical protein
MQLVRAGCFTQAIEPFPTIIQSRERPLTPEALGTVLQLCAEVGPDGFMNQQTAMMNRPDSRPGLGASSCPTVVICASQDSGPGLLRTARNLQR